MIDSRSAHPSSAPRVEAVREARLRLVDALAAKERIETRIAGLRREAALWRDRAQLARRQGDAALGAAADSRAAEAEERLAASMRDRESLDVHIVRLRHDVRSAKGDVPTRPLPPDESRGGEPSPGAPSEVGGSGPDWATLARHQLDDEIEAIRRRQSSQRGPGRAGEQGRGSHGHR